jgi:LPXTG-site transpeptidase (sortase) family protein
VVPRVAGVPRRVVIASPHVDAPVEGVHTVGTALDPPADVGVVGWWADGAWAGAVRGTTLVTGHTVHDGGGVFDDLERVRRGTPVQVQTDRGTIVYVVASVRVLDKGSMARSAGRLFSQSVPGRLVLVTCEGWDGEGYRSNVVVVARPA